MRKFSIKTLLFVVPILLLAVIIEIFLRLIPNDYLHKKKYLDAHSCDIETLILGSSHSFYGIDPNYFSNNTFNASHISQTLDYDFEILKKYQNSFNNLKTVVLPISYFSLFEKLEQNLASWRVKNYVIYYKMNTSCSIYSHSEFLSNQFNNNLRRLRSYYIKGNSSITCTKLGWGTAYNSENASDLIETGKADAIMHTRNDINSFDYVEILKENTLVCNSIIEWCKKRNVKVFLFTPPAYETYYKNLSSEQLKTTIITATDLASEHDKCIYVNLLSSTNFIATDFFDADHLSEIGTKKLSKFINDRIINWE